METDIYLDSIQVQKNEIKLGSGTYGDVKQVNIILKNGEIVTGALKTINREDIISGFGNVSEIESYLIFSKSRFVCNVSTIYISKYFYKERNNEKKEEFISIVTKKAKCNGRELLNNPFLYNLKDVIYYAAQMLISIDFIHKRRYIHRDIKPDNYLIYLNDKKFECFLTDFGFVTLNSNYLKKTPGVNTSYYRAPEVILGINYTNRIDIWSIGCTIYEFATGKILFPEINDKNQPNINFEHIIEEIPLDWDMDAQKLYYDNSAYRSVKILGSEKPVPLTRRENSFMSKFVSSPRYNIVDHTYWIVLDKILKMCLNLNYKTRLNARQILKSSCFDIIREYIDKILEKEDLIEDDLDNIIINIEEEKNLRKVNFFKKAYQKFVCDLKILNIKSIYHAVDLANLYLTVYPDSEMLEENIYSCCLYFFHKQACVVRYPKLPEYFFFSNYTKKDIENNPEKIKEMDKMIYDFEKLVLREPKLLGFNTFRHTLFEISEILNKILDENQIRILFDSFCELSVWSGSYRRMFKTLTEKLFSFQF